MNIKIRLLQLGKRQTDLLDELHKMGYNEVEAPTLSNSISYRLRTPKGDMVRELCDQILTKWEQEREVE